MQHLRNWIGAARVNTLTASLTPVLIGTSYAYGTTPCEFKLKVFIFCLLFAFLCQIGSNFSNDYLDFKKGSDGPDRKGPTRFVSSGLISINSMRVASFITLFFAFLAGLFLIPYGGFKLLIVGIACVFFAWAYTGGPLPISYIGLGDLFVVTFFGLIAVCFSSYLHANNIDKIILLNGLACGFFINNLLVINNIRDFNEDRKSGKNTLIVKFGLKFGIFLLKLSCLITILINLLTAYLIESYITLLAMLPPAFCMIDINKNLLLNDYMILEKFLKKISFNVLLYGIIVSLGFVIIL